MSDCQLEDEGAVMTECYELFSGENGGLQNGIRIGSTIRCLELERTGTSETLETSSLRDRRQKNTRMDVHISWSSLKEAEVIAIPRAKGR